MSRIVLGALALIAAGWTASAQAADFTYGSRAPYTVNQPLNAYSWAGPYLGGNLGYAWGSVDNNPTKPSRFRRRRAGRLQLAERPVGVRRRRRHPGHRRRRYLCAVEILQSLVRHRARPRSATPSTTSCSTAPAGLAFGELRAETFGLSESHTNAGWTAGVGAEFGFAPNWSAKIEYLYVDLVQQQFHHHRRLERLQLRHGARRRQLSLLTATRNDYPRTRNLPAAARGRDFFCTCARRQWTRSFRHATKSPD